MDVAKTISISLAKKAVAATLDDNIIELNRPIHQEGQLSILTASDPKALDVINHSTAHLMAQAIKMLYPDANFGVGPAISEGFYYDVDFKDHEINDESLLKIEKKMHELAIQNFDIVRREVTYTEAKILFADDPYKLELIETHKDEVISIYEQGDFVDLCRGGHLLSTRDIKHFKLLSLAGAYWRGDSNNHMLTRVYGTSFLLKKRLMNI